MRGGIENIKHHYKNGNRAQEDRKKQELQDLVRIVTLE